MKKFTLLTLCLTLLISIVAGPVGAFASEKTEKKQNVISQDKEQKLINTVNPYVVIKDDQYVLTNKDELSSKISKEDLVKVKKMIKKANGLLKLVDDKKISKTDKTFKLTFSDSQVAKKLNKSGHNSLAVALASSNGKTAIDWKWWGATIYLSKSLTESLIAASTEGATTIIGGALGALIPSKYKQKVAFIFTGVFVGKMVSDILSKNLSGAVWVNVIWTGHIIDAGKQ